MRTYGFLVLATILLQTLRAPLIAAPADVRKPDDAQIVAQLFAKYMDRSIAYDAKGVYQLLSSKQTQHLTLSELQEKYRKRRGFFRLYGKAVIDPPVRLRDGVFAAIVEYKLQILSKRIARRLSSSHGTNTTVLYAVPENGQWKVIEYHLYRLPAASFGAEPMQLATDYLLRWYDGARLPDGLLPPSTIVVYGPGNASTRMSAKAWQAAELKRLGGYGSIVNAFLGQMRGKPGRRVCIRTGFYLASVDKTISAAKYDLWFERVPSGTATQDQWRLTAARALPVEPAPNTIAKRRAIRFVQASAKRLLGDTKKQLNSWIANPNDKTATRFLRGAHLTSFKLVGVQYAEGYPWTSAKVTAYLNCTPRWPFVTAQTISLTFGWWQSPWRITSVSPRQKAVATIIRLALPAIALLIAAASAVLMIYALRRNRMSQSQ